MSAEVLTFYSQIMDYYACLRRISREKSDRFLRWDLYNITMSSMRV